MDLECDVCSVNFDLVQHRPKSLPCGHTMCKECIQNPDLDRKCPTCRKDLATDPGDLPDNIIVIQMMENDGAPPRKRPRREDPEVQQLQRGVDAGRKVVEALNRQLHTTATQLRQLEEALEERVQRGAAGDVGTPPAEQLQLAVQLEDTLGLLPTNKCSIVAEGQDGSTWKATVELSGFSDILRLLLLQLREDGQLGKVDDVAVPSPAAYVGPPMLEFLDIHSYDLRGGNLKVNEILREKNRLENIRGISGLKGEGSDRLLRVVASHPLPVEELGFSDAVEPKVMEEVLKMTSLKRLDVESLDDRDDYPDLPLQLEELGINRPSEQQLDCVTRMPSLRSLRLWNYLGSNLTFPPSEYGTLRWLGVSLDTDHKPTMLSLISAHASSLQELQVYCTITEDEDNDGFYFPDLGQDLSTCGLLHLRRLVLERPYNDLCTDVAGCLMQRQNVRGCLPPSVEVVCDACRTSVLG